MKIEDLDIFSHLSRTCHFGKTSKAFHMSPASLTRLIARLETEFGVTLFERDNRNVRLSPEGALFRNFAEQMHLEWEIFRDYLRAKDRPLGGILRITCSVTASYSVLPGILGPFRKENPDVEIQLKTTEADNVIQKILDNEADCGICALGDSIPKNLATKPLGNIPLQCVRQRKEKGQNWREGPFILPEQGLTRQLIDQWFDKQKITPIIYSRLSGYEEILSLASIGCGIGIVPEIVIHQSPLKRRLDIIHSAPSLPKLNIGICCSKAKRRLARIQALWNI